MWWWFDRFKILAMIFIGFSLAFFLLAMVGVGA